jgi:hypothetical protein
MEDKLKFGEGGDPRQFSRIPQETSNTLSLPQIKAQLDQMDQRMGKEIDLEVKMRKDAKMLIINAVRKEPTLDRNVKAWLKAEKDTNQPLNGNQVFTKQYRRLIYEEVKKDKKDFPLMNQFMINGVI